MITARCRNHYITRNSSFFKKVSIDDESVANPSSVNGTLCNYENTDVQEDTSVTPQTDYNVQITEQGSVPNVNVSPQESTVARSTRIRGKPVFYPMDVT